MGGLEDFEGDDAIDGGLDGLINATPPTVSEFGLDLVSSEGLSAEVWAGSMGGFMDWLLEGGGGEDFCGCGFDGGGAVGGGGRRWN